MSEKLRVRTDQEFQEQGQLLEKVQNVLIDNNIEPIVTGGTLLGIVREGDFIPWDWDAEFFVRYDEVSNKFEEIINDFKNNDLLIGDTYTTKEYWKIEVGFTDDFLVEIRAWYEEGEYYKRRNLQVPMKFMANKIYMDLRGVKYLVPKEYEEYLTYVYGDWKTPMKSSSKSEYFADTHRQEKNFFKKLKTYIYRFLNYFK